MPDQQRDPSKTSQPNLPGHPAPDDNLVTPRVPRAFLLLLTTVVGSAAAVVLVPFWAPLFLGITLAATVFPAYQWIATRLPKHTTVAAFITTLGILGVIIAPLVGLFTYAATQLSEGMTWVRHLLKADSWQEGFKRLPHFLQTAVQRILDLFDIELEQLRAYAEQATESMRDWVPALFGMSMSALGTLLMTLITCCVFLVEAGPIKKLVLECIPLKRKDAAEMLGHLRNVSTASFLGLGCTACAHSLVIAVAFWLAGVPHVTFFAILALLAAFVPVISSILLFGPVALILGLTTGPGLGTAVFFGCLVGSQLLENILKPLAQKGRMPLHGALVFFSVIGGLTMFGLMGTIVGPMAMVAATSLFGIYRRDYLGGKKLITQ